MYRPNNPRFNVPPGANRGQHFGTRHSRRAQDDFRKTAPPPHLQSKDAGKPKQPQAPKLPSALKKTFGPENYKWKSSFKTVDEEDKDAKASSDNRSSPDRSTQRSQLYDPYERIKSDSNEHPSPEQLEDSQKSRGYGWDIDANTLSRSLSPGPPRFPGQDDEPAFYAALQSHTEVLQDQAVNSELQVDVTDNMLKTKTNEMNTSPVDSGKIEISTPVGLSPPPPPQQLPPSQHLPQQTQQQQPPQQPSPQQQVPPQQQHTPPPQHLLPPPHHLFPPPQHLLPPPQHLLPPPQHLLPPPQHLLPPPQHLLPPPQQRPPPPQQQQPPPQLVPRPPLPSQQSYKQSSGFSDPDPLPPSRPEVKDPGKNVLTEKNLISCDLCEVELSNGQELEEHLDSKTHWDTLEYIQKHNSYDDMAIAFLQDVMLYKSRKCSRAIEDTALQALQEYDHMTKVEMFQCAACNVFIPTSASAVQNHITTQGHITNTKDFEARQRRLCLDKARTMMKELTPQFQSFVQGVSPFD